MADRTLAERLLSEADEQNAEYGPHEYGASLMRKAATRLAQLEAFRAEVEGLAKSCGDHSTDAGLNGAPDAADAYEWCECVIRAALERVGKVGGEGGRS